MKKVLGLVKGNLLIVIVLAVAVVSIPVMLFFSSRWNQQIRDGVNEDVSKAMSELNAVPVTYEISEMLTGGEAWQSDRVAPNPVLNDKIEQILSMLSSESERVRELAVDRNKEGKGLLVAGDDERDRLFPAPKDEGARVRLLTELTRVRPGAYEALLDEAEAGMPPDSGDLTRQLQARRARLTQEIVAGRVEQKLSEEEEEEIRSRLTGERLDFYNQQASRISMYASPEVFAGVRAWGEEEGLPTLETAWEWQMEHWVAQDIMAAIAKANEDESDRWLAVGRAPVKRILSVDVESWSAVSEGRRFEEPRSAPTDPNAAIVPTYEVSFTGRAGYPVAPNALYDVRYARIDLIVDMNRLPAVLNAIATTNFMSVIDMDFEVIDPGPALEAGFVYGGDAVARVRLRVETIWLRSWMKGWMPAGVRERLGIPPDPEEPGEDEQGE